MPLPQGTNGTAVNPTNWNTLVDAINNLTAGVPPDGVSTFTNGDTTPSVADGNKFKTDATGTTSITTFDDGTDGQEVTIIGAGVTTFIDGATLKCNAGSDRVIGQYDVIKFVLDVTVWCESGYNQNTV